MTGQLRRGLVRDPSHPAPHVARSGPDTARSEPRGARAGKARENLSQAAVATVPGALGCHLTTRAPGDLEAVAGADERAWREAEAPHRLYDA